MSRYFSRALFLLLLACGVVGCKRGPSSPAPAPEAASAPVAPSDAFLTLMNAGKNYLIQADPTNALVTYKKAQALAPNDADLRLNLAMAHLAAGHAEEAVGETEEVLRLEPNSAAAYFIQGSAHLRAANHEEAVKALENAKRIDPGETATQFQLGLARMGLKQWEEAIAAFREGIAMDPNRLHAVPHYLLAQSLRNAGREQEANEALALHQSNIEGGGPAVTASTFERSKFTQPRVPFKLDQPARDGIAMRFVDATAETLGGAANDFSAPLGIIDVNRNGWPDLFALEKGAGFRLLWNSNGVFEARGAAFPIIPGGQYGKILVADLQNDRFDDVIALGDKGSHLFKFATNGLVTEASAFSRLNELKAVDGLLMDLDFTGKLDLLAVSATNHVRLLRQLGPLFFNDVTSTSGIPSTLSDAQTVLMADWNRDQSMDVIATRKDAAPLLLEKQRGGPLAPREPTNWVAGAAFCVGDFDNDLRTDLASVANGKATISFNGGAKSEISVADGAAIARLVAIDYDNDGWLDLWAIGEKIRAWRNVGLSGFEEQTSKLGLDKLEGGTVAEVHFADFDQDCDSDVVVALARGGLRFLRNKGGNANSQIKVQLYGNRSNAGGIGSKIEIESGGLRLARTVDQLPIEIGVGQRQKLDSFIVHWFNWPQGSAELEFNCKEPIFALELTIQEGSCPYLYAWDGESFRFVTDILGAAPLGLPVAPGRYIESDPEELVWIGNEQTFPARNGVHTLQITEELREVLYLDEAKLVVVDHEPDAEVFSTDKLLPGKPFPPGAIVTLHREHPLRHAVDLDGRDVTDALKAIDGKRVSPPRLRSPQLRGLAEPHGITLDFGPLDPSRPLALALNGWLRFGGGMANIAASHYPSLPFPFPTLEAEVSPDVWKQVDVVVGAPAGKTKSIVVDLDGKLPPETRRLRLTQAFEIHWDRIALMEKKADAETRIARVAPAVADLHFRGFSKIKNLPPDWPLTPDYAAVSANSIWTVMPGGWCTRYGDISELIAARDEALALINAGDELTLEFASNSLPPKPPGMVRQFFLYVDGWDKDSDFHVAAGTEVEPLPFHGMDDQLYGRQARPPFPSDALHRKYNTRWVDSKALKQSARR